jgi:hypothetical protein
MRGAIGNALRLRGEWASEESRYAGCEQDMELHAVTSLFYTEAAT